MDPDLVRLILIVFGVLLVVGIYLWDRYKHAMPQKRMARDVVREHGDDRYVDDEPHRASRDEPVLDEVDDYDDDPDEVLGLKPRPKAEPIESPEPQWQQRPEEALETEPAMEFEPKPQPEPEPALDQEPELDLQPQPAVERKPAAAASAPPPKKPGEKESVIERAVRAASKLPASRPARRQKSSLDPDPVDVGGWSTTSRDDDPQFSMDLNFDAHGDNDYLHTNPALRDEVERKIIVINMVAKNSTFSGNAIERACAQNDLKIGDMSIYHRHDGNSDRVLFSMASMVEPGTFPADDMAGFTTPGLSMFTQLPGVRDGVEIYEAMLSTANSLATLLQGELQDERHNKLTRQMQEHTRESIIEHRRKIKLARSRH